MWLSAISCDKPDKNRDVWYKKEKEKQTEETKPIESSQLKDCDTSYWVMVNNHIVGNDNIIQK
jgi:hypothetical protein